MSDLKPANENPWYVLMTLYGEQEGDEAKDEQVHNENALLWNAWVHHHFGTKGVTDAFPNRLLVWEEIRDEVIDLHHKEMLRRNGPSFRYAGFPDDAMCITGMDLTNCEFEKPVNLSELIFAETVDLSGSHFSKLFNIYGSIFQKRFEANSVVFLGEISAEFVSFEGPTKFESSRFCMTTNFSDAFFDQYTVFSNSTFESEARFAHGNFKGFTTFKECEFSKVSFHGSKFNDTAYFSKSKFLKIAEFGSVKFGAEAGFLGVRFSKGVDFSASSFNGISYFTNAQFYSNHSSFYEEVSFSDCVFRLPVSFIGAKFVGGYPIFSGVVFPDQVEFSAEEKLWPKIEKNYYEEGRDTCAIIRHLLSKQGLPEEEHFFFRREMNYTGRIGTLTQQFPYRLYELFSNYGHSIERPVNALAALWLFGVAVFSLHFYGYWFEFVGNLTNLTFNTAMGLSFSNMFPPFGFGRLYFDGEFMQKLPRVLQVFSAFQTVMSLPLLFFLGLGLRQRFRLK